jgi:hypothetical protein
MLGLLRHFGKSRAFTGSSRLKQWPYVDRPSVTDSLNRLMETGSVVWVVGGVGCGKTEMIARFIDKTHKQQKDKSLAFVFDLKNAKQSELDSPTKLTRFMIKTCIIQLASQTSPKTLFSILGNSGVDFEQAIRQAARDRPLWNHLADTTKSFSDLWFRLVSNQSVAIELLQAIRLSDDHSSDLKTWFDVLSSTQRHVVTCFLHLEKLAVNDFDESVLGQFIRPRDSFTVILECNDSLKTLWNIAQSKVVHVPDLPIEAVNALFVPSLLSDETHAKTLFEICGGRVAHLQTLVTPLNLLNEEQRIANEEQEQRYRSGKEIRPSAESKELQVDPLVYKREVALRDLLIDGALKSEVDEFTATMEKLSESFTPLTNLRDSMSSAEFKVLICESIRIILSMLESSSFIAIPAGETPHDIGHPLVLGLLSSNILMVNWLPVPRLQIESPLKLFLLKSWYSATLDEMTIPERIQYNLSLSKNRIHLRKQIEKLVV